MNHNQQHKKKVQSISRVKLLCVCMYKVSWVTIENVKATGLDRRLLGGQAVCSWGKDTEERSDGTGRWEPSVEA